MARFNARSSSTELRPRSRPAKKRRPPPPSSFVRYTCGRKIKTTPSLSLQSRLSFVYVGNLRSDVRDEDIGRLFTTCGKVMKIEIRCCSGVAVPSATNSNTFYATVLFRSVEGATKALAVDGSFLLGKKIVVTPSFFALPEANRAIRRKPISVFGVNLTEFSNNIQHTVNIIRTGGTRQVLTEEG